MSDQSKDEDVVFESEEEVENPQTLVKKLREKLKTCETERGEYLTGWQKAKAEFINLRKKDEELKEEFAKFANQGLIQDVIPILDSFDHALEKNQDAPKEWVSGMISIHGQLMASLAKYGVKKNVPLGETFDPKFHEAVGKVATSKDVEDGKIAEVFQAGYTLHNKLIRPAKVRVAEYGSN